MRRSVDIHGRKLIFLLVLLCHCGLLLVLSRSTTLQTTAPSVRREPLLVFLIDRRENEKDAQALKDQAAAPSPRLKPPKTIPTATPVQPTNPGAASSNAITDWAAEAHTVAKGAIEREPRRAFGHAMSTEEQQPTSIFDPLPVRRAGTWDGPDRYYVTDNCYYQWDRAPRPPPTLLDNSLMTPICKPPPKGGGSAMFKDLTPDYLKRKPEPTSH